MHWEGYVINFAHTLLRRAFLSLRGRGFTGQDRKLLDVVIRDLKNLDPSPAVKDLRPKSCEYIPFAPANPPAA